MSKKQKVTLYLNSAMYARLRAVVDSVPGMSVSGMVDELLTDFLPTMEALVEAAKAGDPEAQAEVMSQLLASQILSMANEGTSAVRQTLKKGESTA